MISIIIRTKNEERWICRCLEKVLNQTIEDIEIILVDNQSTDKTVERAKAMCPGITVVEIDDYNPGFAINLGVQASRGEFLALLSAHCLPVNDNWLQKLLDNFEDSSVAGIYGRQIPMEFSTPVDKRDLLITFGLEKRIQRRDTFFHNANSMIRRDIWDIFPFDENVTNIEDRIWAKDVIEAGYSLIYEPDAPVYHSHGIHQDNERRRYENVVRIMESLDLQPKHELVNPLNPLDLEIVAVIPVRQQTTGGVDSSEVLIRKAIDTAKASRFVDRVIVSTDTKALEKKINKWGAEMPFLRPIEMSLPGVRADDVLQYSLNQLEEQGYFPDLVVPLEITYPFRPEGLLDNLINLLLKQDFDTVIAGFPEYRPCWVWEDGNLVRVDEHETLRHQRRPIHIGLISLGCVTYPEYIRRGTRLGKKIGVFEIVDPIATIEIRTSDDLELFKGLQNIQ